jgi:hypothetical protein
MRLTLRLQPGAELLEDECELDAAGIRHHVPPFKKQKSVP